MRVKKREVGNYCKFYVIVYIPFKDHGIRKILFVIELNVNSTQIYSGCARDVLFFLCTRDDMSYNDISIKVC